MQPTLLIGVGQCGGAVVDEVAAHLRAHFVRFAPGVVTAYVRPAETDTGDDETSERLPPLTTHQPPWVFQVTGARDGSSVVDLAQAFESAKGAFNDRLAESTRQLLDTTNLAQAPDGDASTLQVFIVASLEEEEGVAWVVPLAEQIAATVAQTHPTLTLRTSGLWLLPEGAHPLSGDFCDTLKRVEQAHVDEPPPYHFVWLLSPVNPQDQRLNDEDRRRAAAAFLLAHVATDLPSRLWHPDQQFAASCRMGSLSAVRLEFPADTIVAQHAPHAARALIMDMLDPDTSVANAGEPAARWLADNGADLTALQNALSLGGDGKPLSEQVQLFQPDPTNPQKKIPLIEPERVPMEEWVGLLTSFDALYRRERLPALLEQVDAGTARRAQELFDVLTQAVDAQAESHCLPARALAFVRALFEQVNNVREAFGYHLSSQRSASSPDIPHLDELKQAIINLPGPWALSLRLLLICIVVWAPVSWLVMPITQKMSSSLSALATEPLKSIVGALVVGVALAIYGALRYDAAKGRVWEALRRVLDGMEENYRAELMNRVRQRVGELLNHLYCRLAADAALEREFKGYTGPNDQRALRAFEETLQRTPDEIREPPSPAPSAFAVSVLSFGDEPADFPYKEGRFILTEEARMFLEGGGYHGWRQLTPGALAQRLSDYTARGYDYVRRLRLDAWMQDQLSADELRGFWHRVGPLCEPFLCCDFTRVAQPPALRRWLLVAPEAGEGFCDWLTQPAGGNWEHSRTLPHPHWASLLTLRDYAECERLEAWAVWSKKEVSA